MTLFKLIPATSTHRGMRRKQNEDAVGYKYPDNVALLQSHGALFVVADGVGGLSAGDATSNMAVERLIKRYYDTDAEIDPEARLAQAVTSVNADVYDKFKRKGATTLAAIVILNDTIIAASVGDSLIFHIRDGVLEQLNEEDILRDATSRENGALTQAIGYRDTIDVQIITGAIAPGDKLLVCSDGLTRYLKHDELTNLSNLRDPRDAVRRMINDANTRGGADNISAILLQVGDKATAETIKDHIARLVIPVSIESQAMMMMEHEPGKPHTRIPMGRREVVDVPVQDRPTPKPITAPASQSKASVSPSTSQAQGTRSKPPSQAKRPKQGQSSSSSLLIIAGVSVLVIGAVLFAFALGRAGGDTDVKTPIPATSVITEEPEQSNVAATTEAETLRILNGEIILNDYVFLQSSVLTVDRVGDEVGSYVANANVAYLVDNITEYEGQIWYRLLNENTNEMGWVVASDLPTYELQPNSE